jgi:hypothetical protein
MSYMPPELARDPIEITQRGSIICSEALDDWRHLNKDRTRDDHEIRLA